MADDVLLNTAAAIERAVRRAHEEKGGAARRSRCSRRPDAWSSAASRSQRATSAPFAGWPARLHCEHFPQSAEHFGQCGRGQRAKTPYQSLAINRPKLIENDEP